MTYKHIEFSVKENIGWIYLNRPDQGNALNLEMSKELRNLSQKIAFDDRVSVIVLTGRGRNFSFGGDLSTFLDGEKGNADNVKMITVFLNEFINQMHSIEKPIITGINGTAAGAGMGLSILGDIIIAQEKTKFTMAYTNVGLTPDGSISYYLPKIIGLNRALELTLTNRVLTSQEAKEWGLVTKVVSDDDLLSELDAMAQKIVNGPKEAIKKAKSLIYRSYNQTLESQLFQESNIITKQMNHFEGVEGVSAFIEKRKPNFR